MERARNYALTFERRPHYVSVKLSSQLIDHVTVLDYLGEIAVTCAKWHTRALLIERDVPMVLSEEEMLDSWGVFLNTRTEMRVALLNPHLQIEKPLRQMLASASGDVVRTAYFGDRAEAERWMEA